MIIWNLYLQNPGELIERKNQREFIVLSLRQRYLICPFNFVTVP